MSSKTTENIQLRSNWSYSQDIHFRIGKKSALWTDSAHLWHPPTDLLETELHYLVTVEIAGMQDAQMTIAIEDRSLAIHGARHHETAQAAYHQMEISSGDFISIVELPSEVDHDQIKMNYSDGFLHIKLTKRQA